MQSQVIRTAKPLLFNDVVERVKERGGKYYEFNPDGSRRDLGANAPPANVRSAIMVPLLSEGAVVGVVQVMSNTERAYDERHLALLEGITLQLGAALENARLYRRAQEEIEERRRVEAQLREAKDAAEAASRAKGEFLATLSHELRTPLTPVLLTVSLIESHPDLPDEVREDVATIRRNVELESQLISDLLDLTRIERGKLQLEFQCVDLHLILRSAIDICQREASAKLTADLGAARHTVQGDGTRLQQIFWNLINNAIKFTPQQGTITVRTSNAGDDGESRVRVEVIDTGAGIDPSMMPKLFSAFEQGEVRAARQQAGLGLGLAISKKLTEAHGGTIAVRSAGRGRGSTFIVELPVAVGQFVRVASPVERPAVLRAAPQPLNVLLVEDHEPTLRVLEKLLRQIGHRVTGTTTVTTALAAAAQEAFDLIISDLGLPDGSGLDVMRRLRRDFAGRAIALTGYGMDADVDASRAAGFALHLTKPVDRAQLESAIERVTSSV
jgi:signal transduction histidine kinase